jgi:hypothetical protein
MTPPPASPLVVWGFVVIPLLVAGGYVAGCDWAARRLGVPPAVRRLRTARIAVVVAGWLLLTLLAAASGVLRRFDAVPPPFAFFLLAVAAAGVVAACSPAGTLLVRGLPLWVLVGAQAFRLPLELLMHRSAVEGVMPAQMSNDGLNYDIATGATAVALARWLLRGRPPRAAVALWNALGLALLVNVVTVAVVSTPLFRWFGDQRLNTFVAYPPFVWLPAVLVAAALAGHLLVWRKLRAARVPAPPAR